jgi:hypothetical protein
MESSVERITWKRIGQEILAQLQLEKGLLFTVRDLLVRPGQAIRSVLFSENRSLYVKPVGFLIFTAALATFSLLQFGDVDSYFSESFREGFEYGYTSAGGEEPDEEVMDEVAREAQLKISYITVKYFNLLIILNLPIFAFFTWLFFRKEGFFYTEHLVLNIYLIGMQNILFIPVGPFIYTSSALNLLASILGFGYLFYAYFRIFKSYSSGRRILNSIFCIACGTLGYLIAFTGGAILAVRFLPIELPA